MNIKKSVKSKTILISMSISYLIIFFMTILLGVFGYVKMEKVLKKNIHNFYDTKVELLSNEISQYLATLGDSVYSLGTNEFLKRFSDGKSEMDYTYARDFISDINSNIGKMSGVKYMGVYLKNRDLFVTNQGFSARSSFTE